MSQANRKAREGAMKFRLECRSTGVGALTTMDGEQFNASRSGNHWEEVIDVPVGERFYVVDISGSGKHRCRWMTMTAEGAVADAGPSCLDYWPGGECPVCKH